MEWGERGRALLGPVVSWTSPLEKGTERHEWSHPKYGHSRKFAGLKSLPLFRARIDGGTSGPRVASTNFEITLKLQTGERAVGHFCCSEPPVVQNHAPDFPSKRLHRGSSPPTAAGKLESEVSRAKRVAQSRGGSECNHPAESVGPRRYTRWREYIRWRCLYDVDDGVCIVCFTSSVKQSRLKSLRAGQLGRFLGGVPGELLRADSATTFTLNTGGEVVHFFFILEFLVQIEESQNSLHGLRLGTLNLAYPRVGIIIRRASVGKTLDFVYV